MATQRARPAAAERARTARRKNGAKMKWRWPGRSGMRDERREIVFVRSRSQKQRARRRRRQRKKDRKWIGDGRGLAEDGATRGARKSIFFGKLLAKSMENVPRRMATASCKYGSVIGQSLSKIIGGVLRTMAAATLTNESAIGDLSVANDGDSDSRK